jgi:hypothetical protein
MPERSGTLAVFYRGDEKAFAFIYEHFQMNYIVMAEDQDKQHFIRVLPTSHIKGVDLYKRCKPFSDFLNYD